MVNDFRLPGDVASMQVLNHLDSPLFDSLCVAASSQEFGLGLLVVLVAALIVRERKAAVRGLLLLGVAIGATDGFGAQVLKPFFARTRPCFADPENIRLLAPIADTGSLPSLHAANSFAVLTVMAALFPRLALTLLPVAVLISISRVVVGVHWLSDVVVGSCYGVAVATLVLLIDRQIQKRFKAREPAGAEA